MHCKCVWYGKVPIFLVCFSIATCLLKSWSWLVCSVWVSFTPRRQYHTHGIRDIVWAWKLPVSICVIVWLSISPRIQVHAHAFASNECCFQLSYTIEVPFRPLEKCLISIAFRNLSRRLISCGQTDITNPMEMMLPGGCKCRNKKVPQTKTANIARSAMLSVFLFGGTFLFL